MEGITITLHEDELEIDGVRVSYAVLPHLILSVVRPDPRRWLRFQRLHNIVHVHVRLSEGEPYGTDTAIIGRGGSDEGQSSPANPGWQGQKTAHS